MDDYDQIVNYTTYVRDFTEMFEILDKDNDGLLNVKELEALDNEAWATVGDLLQVLLEDVEDEFEGREIDIDYDHDRDLGEAGDSDEMDLPDEL